MDDRIGSYESRRFPAARLISVDVSEIGLGKHYMTALVEFDVTKARQLIREYRRAKQRGLSFLAWFLKCIGQAISEHREVQAFVGRGRRLVLFDDVDIGFLVEKDIGGSKIPVPYLVRKANVKSLDEINSEILAAQAQAADDEKVSPGELPPPWIIRLYPVVPAFVRRAIIRLAMNPFRAKKMMGTVAVTAVGMYGKTPGWAVPIGVQPICFAIGAIVDKPAVVGGKVEIHEHLYVTVQIDHDAVDGAPAARFINRLRQLVESGYGLTEQESAD